MNDPFGRSRMPRTLTREGRVELVGEVAEALRDGRMPDPEGAMFVGAALLAWLEADGGDLGRHFLRVCSPRGSRHTPAFIWQRIRNKPSSSMNDTRRATEHDCAVDHFITIK